MTKSGLVKLSLIAFFFGVWAGSVFEVYVILILLAIFCFFFVLILLLGTRVFARYRVNIFVVFRCFGVCFLGGVLSISLTIPDFDENDIGFYRDMDASVLIEGLIVAEPEARNGAQYVLLEAERLIYGTIKVDVKGRVLLKLSAYPEYKYGDAVSAYGRVLKPAEFEQFSYADYLAKDSVYAVMYGAKVKLMEHERILDVWRGVFFIKNTVQERVDIIFEAPGSSIVLGLLLGMRSSIPREILDNFQTSGLTHILAISGYNITLIITVFGLILKGYGRRFRFVGMVLAIAIFAMLTGLSASVVRASIMGGLMVFSLFAGRKSDGVQMLLFSGFFMVLFNPRILTMDVSFQLSFMSTLGLLILLPLWESYFKKLPAIISESLAVTLAATVFTTPIILYHFGRFSIISPIANIIFLPLIPLIMFGSFVAIISSFLFLPFTIIFVGICWFFIFLLVEGVNLVAKIPFALIEIQGFNEYAFFLYYFFLWLIILFRKSRSGQAS